MPVPHLYIPLRWLRFLFFTISSTRALTGVTRYHGPKPGSIEGLWLPVGAGDYRYVRARVALPLHEYGFEPEERV